MTWQDTRSWSAFPGGSPRTRCATSFQPSSLPPTRESLVARLEGRKTESQEQLRLRLSEADGEIGAACDSGCYPYFVINDVLEETVKEVISIIDKETQES